MILKFKIIKTIKWIILNFDMICYFIKLSLNETNNYVIKLNWKSFVFFLKRNRDEIKKLFMILLN